MLFVCCSFPISVAMKSSLLFDIIWYWEKVQCTLNGASVAFTFLSSDARRCNRWCQGSNATSTLCIAFQVLSRSIQTSLHCQCPESFALSSYWTGCRLCSVVNLVEEIVGEGGSRFSSQIHEHDSCQLVSQQNVVIQVFWSRCQPRLTLWALVICTTANNRFHRSIGIYFVFENEVLTFTRETWMRCLLRADKSWALVIFNTAKNRFPRSIVSHSFFTKRTCFDFLWMGRSSLRAKNKCPRSIMIWVWIWLAWLGFFCMSRNFSFWLKSNFWTLFFHPVMFQVHLWRRPWWRTYLLVCDFSGFHPNNLQKKLGVFREEW